MPPTRFCFKQVNQMLFFFYFEIIVERTWMCFHVYIEKYIGSPIPRNIDIIELYHWRIQLRNPRSAAVYGSFSEIIYECKNTKVSKYRMSKQKAYKCYVWNFQNFLAAMCHLESEVFGQIILRVSLNSWQ